MNEQCEALNHIVEVIEATIETLEERKDNSNVITLDWFLAGGIAALEGIKIEIERKRQPAPDGDEGVA